MKKNIYVIKNKTYDSLLTVDNYYSYDVDKAQKFKSIKEALKKVTNEEEVVSLKKYVGIVRCLQ